MNFNPRSREGSDGCKIEYAENKTFQSTLPRGERQATFLSYRPVCLNFNPRSREGSDENLREAWRLLRKFQSTLPRGERLRRNSSVYLAHDFNPRSREGSDVRAVKNCTTNNDFNPRSREGSDITVLLWP